MFASFRRPLRPLVLAGALPALAASAALAQAPRAARAPLTSTGAPARVLKALPATGIHVDGRLDEAAWATAAPAADFVQQAPNDGRPATERTEARVLFEADAVYVGMRMYDAHPDSILAQLTRRDQGSTSDGARVFIDSYNDKRTAFVFGLNPRGVKDDFLRFDDGSGVDSGWDAVWDGATHVDSLGWTAEFRIPLSQLRFNAALVNAGGRWGLNFRRYIARRDEIDFWAPVPPNSNGFVSLFGELEGLTGLRQAQRLEILPYTSARLDRPLPDHGNPYWSASETSASVGADIKAGLPGGLTLSATINPDFGQVEVDPAVVNLSAYETFFPERRPFFTEGADIFQFGQINVFNSYGGTRFFYSRRIGRQPQGAVRVDEAEHTDVPDASTILGAAKVSGKTGGWSVGLMDALTQREVARFRTVDGTDGRYPVEPLTNYLVGRVRRDLNGGATVLGGMVTGVSRSLTGDEFDPYLRSGAYVAGVDGQHAWHNREWTLSGYLAGGQVTGSPEAIARTQRSSAHYYNRPDADYLRYDDTRTSLAGRMAGAAISHGGLWDMSLAYQEVAPGFETNDIGFENRGDTRAFSTFLGQRVQKPTRLLRSHSHWIYTTSAWNFGGDNIYQDLGLGANATFKSLYNVGVEAGYEAAHQSDRLTRGGPLMATPGAWRVSLNGGTDSRKIMSLNGYVFVRETSAGGYEHSGGATLNYRPTTSVQFSLGPSYSRVVDTDQWVRTDDDATATQTFGRRYVFARLDQTTVAMDTRLDWTFTPTLSLQLFAQPFAASGAYDGYRALAAPRTRDFTPSTGSGDDFTVLSLRGNAVLRWEYRPGSTLFFVWQQERFGDSADGTFRFGDSARGVFQERARNVFVMKATYWLNR